LSLHEADRFVHQHDSYQVLHSSVHADGTGHSRGFNPAAPTGVAQHEVSFQQQSISICRFITTSRSLPIKSENKSKTTDCCWTFQLATE